MKINKLPTEHIDYVVNFLNQSFEIQDQLTQIEKDINDLKVVKRDIDVPENPTKRMPKEDWEKLKNLKSTRKHLEHRNKELQKELDQYLSKNNINHITIQENISEIMHRRFTTKPVKIIINQPSGTWEGTVDQFVKGVKNENQ